MHDARVLKSHSAASEAAHGVKLVERGNDLGKSLSGDSALFSDLSDFSLTGGEELMERRVKVSNDNWSSINFVKDFLEVFLLKWLKLGKSDISSILILGNNHLSKMLDSLLFEEHVLGSAKSDTLGAIFKGDLDLFRLFGVSFDHHGLVLLGPAKNGHEIVGHFSFLDLDLSGENFTSTTIDGQVVTFVESSVTDSDSLGLVVDDQVTASSDTALTHTSGNDSGVGGHSTSSGKNTLGSVHTNEIFGSGLDSGQDHSLTSFSPFIGLMRVENDSTNGGAWRGWKASGDLVTSISGSIFGLKAQLWVEKLI